MKKLTQLAAAIALSTAGVAAQADVSANVGLVSDYYFRGMNLGDAGVYAGADYEAGGFYAGTWLIDDGTAGNDGLETDFYFGYGMETEGGLSLGLGYARYEYTYTGDFEQEVSFTAGFGGFGLELTTGEDDDEGASDAVDYDFIALSYGGEVFGATIGTYENDADDEYTYIELSASGEVNGFDVGFSIGKTTGVKSGGVDAPSGDSYMVLDISKSFDL